MAKKKGEIVVTENNKFSALTLGLCILLGLSALGWLLSNAAITFKEYERSVSVKGLSEKEYPADVVIWPIAFIEAGNDLGGLYTSLEQSATKIRAFLDKQGIPASEISISPPAITDKSAQSYGDSTPPEFRYSGEQTVTVYSKNITAVRAVMNDLSQLGKQGIAFTGNNYQATEYLFTRLNEIKPEMIEEATKNAREVAAKFAADSKSRLGKIKRASQGQFTIEPRDNNNPHIKQVRVVSTVEYYLSD